MKSKVLLGTRSQASWCERLLVKVAYLEQCPPYHREMEVLPLSSATSTLPTPQSDCDAHVLWRVTQAQRAVPRQVLDQGAKLERYLWQNAELGNSNNVISLE